MEKGFTLIEMLAVMLILALLAAAVTGGLSSARSRAWRTQTREACRQLCQAWNAYLVDERRFPEALGASDQRLPAEYANIRNIADKEQNPSGRVYIELKDPEKQDGLRDHWGQLLWFSLDADYDGVIRNPHPEAFGSAGTGANAFENIRATSLAWSKGDPRKANRKDNPIVIW